MILFIPMLSIQSYWYTISSDNKMASDVTIEELYNWIL